VQAGVGAPEFSVSAVGVLALRRLWQWLERSEEDLKSARETLGGRPEVVGALPGAALKKQNRVIEADEPPLRSSGSNPRRSSIVYNRSSALLSRRPR
jgi:hypothetical protein